MRDSGEVQSDRVFFSGESWFATHPDSHNAQNDRAHVRPDDAAAAPQLPKRQRSPGVMVRMALSQAGGGFTSRVHFAPKGVMVDQKCYRTLLQSEVPPECRAVAPKFRWAQDGAPRHTLEPRTFGTDPFPAPPACAAC